MSIFNTDNINTDGLTANTISATTYFNLPPSNFTGGTVNGLTTFTNGLNANTFSATTINGDGSGLTNLPTPYGLITVISTGNYLI